MESIKNFFKTIFSMPIARLLEWSMAGLMLLLIAPIVAMFFYWMVIQPVVLGYNEPIEITTLPYRPQVVMAGDTLEIYRVFCFNRVMPATIYREFRDGVIIPLPESRTSFASFDHNSCSFVTTQVEVPAIMDREGLYYYNARFDFEINPIYTASVRPSSVYFYVVSAMSKNGEERTLADLVAEFGRAPDDLSMYPPELQNAPIAELGPYAETELMTEDGSVTRQDLPSLIQRAQQNITGVTDEYANLEEEEPADARSHSELHTRNRGE